MEEEPHREKLELHVKSAICRGCKWNRKGWCEHKAKEVSKMIRDTTDSCPEKKW